MELSGTFVESASVMMNTKQIYMALMALFLIVAAACAPEDEKSTGVAIDLEGTGLVAF